jgi:nicotinate-nucleotide adenylyltransferase
MRLGIFGGTFDPVHFGHLLLAEQCRETCRLDEVWFLPSGSPPHKEGAGISAAAARAEMLELATAGHAAFSVSRMEFERTGATFTIDTLAQLRAENPSRELFFLIGGDSLDDFPKWREPGQIAELATIVAVNRGDQPAIDLAGVEAKLGEAVASRIQVVTMPGVSLSASDIRRRVRTGKSIRYMTPAAVEVYIAQHKLYLE